MDREESFRTLRDVEFDGVVTSCVFAWEERARESSEHMLERVTEGSGV